MGLATRRLIQTIARRNRSTEGAGGRARLICIGKDMLGMAGPSLAPVGIDEENCGATFVITSNQQDRDGDIIRPRGINLDSFKRSPVWFWNHQQNPYPIGTSWHPKTGQVMIKVENDQIIATCYFDQEDPEAMKIFGKIQRKMISACSIGFVPVRMDRLKDKANRDRLSQPAGYDVEEAELVEVSITGVGSNRQALLVGRSFSPKARQEYGAKMKNRIKNLPTCPGYSGKSAKIKQKSHFKTVCSCGQVISQCRCTSPTKVLTTIPNGCEACKIKVLGNGENIAETEKPEMEKSSAADVQHVALSKQQFPNQADAVSLMDKQGMNTDDVRETDTDWEFHQFPPEELVPDSGHYEDLADGIKAFAGQRVAEPASDLTPEKDADEATEAEGSAGGDLVEEDGPLKPGAQIAMDCIAYVTDALKVQEDEDLIPLLEDFLDELKKYAKMKHPDLDLYDDSDEVGTADETAKDMDEGSEMEESLTPYRHARRLRTKGMSKRCMKSIEAAAGHLEDVSEMDPADQKACRMMKSGSRYHAKELRDMLEKPNDSQDANMFDDEPESTGKSVVLSLKEELELATKAASGYDKLSKQVLGR